MQKLRQHAFDMLRRGGYDQGAAVALAQKLRAFADGGRVVQETAAVAEKLLPFAGQHQAARDPIEQLEAELAFQIADLARQGRLRDVQLLRRFRNGAQLRHGDEGSRSPQIHPALLCRIGMKNQRKLVLDA
ncbi:MAG TPA: hypothetical protein VMU42_14635 [Candidatus Sulfotelmatobacter sp.]|nr:hypothetical protein [Candidatus Sulfotelmatobacter sp.]